MVLDGSDTLYATLDYAAVDDTLRRRLESLEVAEAAGPRLLHRANTLRAWVKLRPGLAAMLDTLAPRCDVWIAVQGEGGEALTALVDGEAQAVPAHRVFSVSGDDCRLPEVRVCCTAMRWQSSGSVVRLFASWAGWLGDTIIATALCRSW